MSDHLRIITSGRKWAWDGDRPKWMLGDIKTVSLELDIVDLQCRMDILRGLPRICRVRSFIMSLDFSTIPEDKLTERTEKNVRRRLVT